MISTSSTLPIYTMDQIADFLAYGYWGGGTRNFSAKQGDTIHVEMNMSSNATATALRALSTYTEFTGIKFSTESTSGAKGWIKFSEKDGGGGSTKQRLTISFDQENDTYRTLKYGAEIKLGRDWASDPVSFTPLEELGNFHTFLHEIGHAMGLGHAGSYNGSHSIDDMHYQNDSLQVSQMSYFLQGENPYIDASNAAPVTPMVADILAFEKLYGVPTGLRAGNTVYGTTTTETGIYKIISDSMNAVPNKPIGFTVYDQGGYDTLDFSLVVKSQRIDLAPGSYSDVYGFKGNMGIAIGTIIEKAIGGSGHDTLKGNAAANHLIGNAGNDVLDGSAGNDVFSGGGGNDTLIGGVGADHLNGGLGNDVLVIDNSDDVVVEAVNGGSDRIHSSIGIDLNRAGGVYANVENLVLSGITAKNGLGSDVANSIIGNAADNYLAGRGGNDILMGGVGADSLNGGAGVDRASYTNATSRVVADLANASVNVGDAAGDTYAGIENVTGSLYNDWINGDAGANSLHGYDGNDTVHGRAGNDILTGGAGSDTFIFAKNYDADRVIDFQNNVDQIRLLSFGVTSFAEAKTYATQSGTNVIFDFGSGDTLRIDNITINALSDDMIFV